MLTISDNEGPWHRKERNAIILQLQKFSKSTKTRVTIISGDIHEAAVARITTDPKIEIVSPENDSRLMYQLISSPISNSPAPKMLQRIYAWGSTRVLSIKHKIPNTIEEILPFFKKKVLGGLEHRPHRWRKVMGRRNWCQVSEFPTEMFKDYVSVESVQDQKLYEIASREYSFGNCIPLARVCYHVEAIQGDKNGKCAYYEMNIPRLV